MGVAIASIGIPSISIQEDDKGMAKMEGTYTLISEKGIVMAKQSFNSYQGLSVDWSKETKQLIEQLRRSVESELSLALGLGEENDGKSD